MRDYLMDEVNTYYALLTVIVVALFAGMVLLRAVHVSTFEIVLLEASVEDVAP